MLLPSFAFVHLPCRQQPTSGNALVMHFDSGNPDLLLLSAPATAALLLLRVSPPALCRQQPASGNALALHFDSGNPDLLRNSWQQAVYIAAGSDPFALVDASVAAAAAIAGERCCPAVAILLSCGVVTVGTAYYR